MCGGVCVHVWGGGVYILTPFFYLQIAKRRRLCGLVALADSCQGTCGHTEPLAEYTLNTHTVASMTTLTAVTSNHTNNFTTCSFWLDTPL